MTAEQKLRLIQLLCELVDVGKDYVIDVSSYAQNEDGSRDYELRIEGITSTGEWGLLIEEVIR